MLNLELAKHIRDHSHNITLSGSGGGRVWEGREKEIVILSLVTKDDNVIGCGGCLRSSKPRYCKRY